MIDAAKRRTGCLSLRHFTSSTEKCLGCSVVGSSPQFHPSRRPNLRRQDSVRTGGQWKISFLGSEKIRACSFL